MTPTAQKKVPGKKFLHPRFWSTWIGVGVLWLISRLPYNFQQRVGRAIGRLTARLLRSRARITQINLALAFPELDASEIALLSDRVFEHIGMGIAEAACMWFRPVSFFREYFTIEGIEHLEEARRRGKGVIILQAHFTLIEAAAAVIGSEIPMSAVVDRPKNELLGALLKFHREKYVSETIDNHSIRRMIRRLKNNEIVWYSPDLFVPAYNGGILTQYFSQPVLTTDGIARIAKLTNATLVPYFPDRRGDNELSRLVFEAPLNNMNTDDLSVATQQMNDHFEKQIRRQPEQYFWVHKRFKAPDHTFNDPYNNISHPRSIISGSR